MLVNFNLTLLNLTKNSLPETHLQSFLLDRICGEQSLCFLLLLFQHYIVLRFQEFILTTLRIPETPVKDLVKDLAYSRPC